MKETSAQPFVAADQSLSGQDLRELRRASTEVPSAALGLLPALLVSLGAVCLGAVGVAHATASTTNPCDGRDYLVDESGDTSGNSAIACLESEDPVYAKVVNDNFRYLGHYLTDKFGPVREDSGGNSSSDPADAATCTSASTCEVQISSLGLATPGDSSHETSFEKVSIDGDVYLTGTTDPDFPSSTSVDLSTGRLRLDGSSSGGHGYTSWISGGRPSRGDTDPWVGGALNLAFYSNATNDDLYINPGDSYSQGTFIGGPVAVGYQVKKCTTGSSGRMTCSCPSGTTMVGGGAIADNGGDEEAIRESYPNGSNGWVSQCMDRETGSGDERLCKATFVICTRLD